MQSRTITLALCSLATAAFCLITGVLFLGSSPIGFGSLSILGEHLSRARPVSHIVLFSLKSDTQAADVNKVAHGMMALQQNCIHPISKAPYILGIRGGANISPQSIDTGITHAFIVDFKSPEHLEYYLEHDPVHKDYQAMIGPFMKMQTVRVDFQHGRYTPSWWDS